MLHSKSIEEDPCGGRGCGHTIKAVSTDGIWITGSVDGHPFGIKVSDQESGFGIGNGRVLKLYVNDRAGGNELFAYERGWETPPSTPEQNSLLNVLLGFAAGLPKQEIWRGTLLNAERTFRFADSEAPLNSEQTQAEGGMTLG